MVSATPRGTSVQCFSSRKGAAFPCGFSQTARSGKRVISCQASATASSRSVLDKPLKDLTLKKGVLLAAIARENKIIIPGGLTTIQEGDHVVVVTKSQVFDDLTDILA